MRYIFTKLTMVCHCALQIPFTPVTIAPWGITAPAQVSKPRPLESSEARTTIGPRRTRDEPRERRARGTAGAKEATAALIMNEK
jgi:hypothetical protein